jgi:hypothetical protein
VRNVFIGRKERSEVGFPLHLFFIFICCRPSR